MGGSEKPDTFKFFSTSPDYNVKRPRLKFGILAQKYYTVLESTSCRFLNIHNFKFFLHFIGTMFQYKSKKRMVFSELIQVFYNK